MAMSDPASRIRTFIISNFLFGKDSGLSDDASFLENGIVDSTGVMELVAFLEKEFGIKIDDHELVPDNLDSIQATAAFVVRKTGKAG